MKRFIPFLLLSLCTLASAGDNREQVASVVLQVADRSQALTSVLAQAEARGGYFLSWDEWSASLRVPSEQLKDFLKSLDSIGYKSEQSYSTTDQSDEIENLSASIASRRKLLDSYFAMVQNAQSNQLQVIERAIITLVQQIETDEGRLRGMQTRTQVALVQVSFRFTDRSLPTPSGDSPYPWINGINLSTHRGEF